MDDVTVPVLTYTADNRHETKIFELIENAITEEEVAALKEFAESQIPEASEDETSQKVEMANRPDKWDSAGVIAKIQDIFRDYVRNTYFLVGSLEPRKFVILRTDDVQEYSETYGRFQIDGVLTYTAIMPLSKPDVDCRPGEILFTVHGEGFKSEPGNLIVFRNEEFNSWKIPDMFSGTRFDLILVLQEINKSMTYDEFEIEPLEDNGVPY